MPIKASLHVVMVGRQASNGVEKPARMKCSAWGCTPPVEGGKWSAQCGKGGPSLCLGLGSGFVATPGLGRMLGHAPAEAVLVARQAWQWRVVSKVG